MDFNDIKSRLERGAVALNTQFDTDYKKHTNIKFIDTKGGTGIELTFGKDSKTEVEYKIVSILQGLATLKDHLKNCLANNWHQAKIVEDEVNACLHLQVLVDLVNADKHKYPTNLNRSEKNPIIKNAQQALALGGTVAGEATEINIGSD